MLTGGVTAGPLASTCTVGLMVTGEADLAIDGEADLGIDGEADLAIDGAGAGAGAGAGGGDEGGTGVTVVDLLGAGLMGGTFMDDIITTGGVAAGTVLTTTVAVDLAGSNKRQGQRGDMSKT